MPDMRQTILIIGLLLLHGSCSKTDRTTSDTVVDTVLIEFDNYLKSGLIDSDHIDNYINRIETNLVKLDKKKYQGQWTTRATFKFNSDSSVTLIKSDKTWRDGHKKEVIIHIGDSILFIKHFEVLTENQNPTGYELLEIIEYLTDRKNLVTLIRWEYPKSLKDTIEFKREPYGHLDLGEKLDYLDKLNYARTIMEWN